MEKEIWKDVGIIKWINYTWLYKVSNLWNVKSLKRIDNNNHLIKEKLLKKEILKTSYVNITLCKFWKTKRLLIHRLVCLIFLDNPKNKEQVNHKNGIRDDNRLINLEWCTRSENELHKCRVLWNKPKNIWRFWKNNYRSKKVNQYTKDWIFIKTWDCITDIERELKIWQSNVGSVCRLLSNTAWWYKWEYLEL